MKTQVNPPTQAAKWVTMQADTGRRLAPSTEPPLKPNQPTQRKTVPIMTWVTLMGVMGKAVEIAVAAPLAQHE